MSSRLEMLPYTLILFIVKIDRYTELHQLRTKKTAKKYPLFSDCTKWS